MGRLPKILNDNSGIVNVGEVVQPISNFEQEYFDHLKSAGTNLMNKGAWQKMYAFYMDRVFGIRNKTVLDIGCAFGAISSAFADFGAKVYANDISVYAKEKSSFKNINFINCDMCDIDKHISADSVDFVHSMFAVNLIKEEECERLFKAINTVCKNDAIVFIILSMGIQKRTENLETIQPKYYWDEIAGKMGMKDGARSYYQKLMETNVPGWEFMRLYQWPFLVYKVVKNGQIGIV